MRPAWLLRLGLFIYDHLGGRKILAATNTIDLSQHELGRPLKGRTKLNVSPRPAEALEFVEREEPDDIEALVTALCDWSERYGVAWVLDIDGRRQGRVERGRCGWCLRRRLRRPHVSRVCAGSSSGCRGMDFARHTGESRFTGFSDPITVHQIRDAGEDGVTFEQRVSLSPPGRV